ncbi:hydantoinase B/oxoprolinase family protein [Sneathiella litorea]|uniref:Hydantoinase B/oxoprolinase family protein n=1 Tax=Sneathiella litorea TaxID=2606216 RepID=A0A6L8W8L3_9PROT|nr:hydantoinase B/oxoprolinase family protein [Sneathiella litorea]MZR30730.1 hydantoinase B/oxoprolinase family protein [Sneathiella litorea]
MEHQQKTNPFLLEVLRNAFDTVAEEITLTIIRTAYSQIVRDSLDFSTALCDAQGRAIAQGVCTPMHLGSFHDALTNMIHVLGNEIHENDYYIMNDPYEAAGQHLPDIYVVKPVFHEDQLKAWSTTLAHHSDVGGIVAGSNALGATEVWQEGLRIPVLKLVDKGVRNETLWKMIAINVRTPDLVFGDLQAQMAACTTGAKGLQKLYERYGPEVIDTAIDDINAYAKRLAQEEISEIPNGIYEFTDHIDGIGDNPEPIIFQAKLTVEDKSIIVDWEGSSRQVAGGVNSTFPFTKACAYAALRSVMKSDIPNCHGFTEVIDVRAPLGSVLNPVLPGATGARGITGYRMIDCLMGALSKAVPDRVTADGSGGSTLPTISGMENGKTFIFCETAMGVWGASQGSDGQEGVPHIGANQSNIPIEMIEAAYPIRIEEYGFVDNSGGAGKKRGGLSIKREYRILSDVATLNIRSDKRDFPPHGLFGGANGAPSMNIIKNSKGERVLPVLLSEPIQLRKGDIFSHVMASGGGYGPANEREEQEVLNDILLSKVTISGAEKDYGVVIVEEDSRLSIDTVATSSIRNKMEAA